METNDIHRERSDEDGCECRATDGEEYDAESAENGDERHHVTATEKCVHECPTGRRVQVSCRCRENTCRTEDRRHEEEANEDAEDDAKNSHKM